MNCDYYRVLFRGIVLAEKMTLETALILIKALFNTYPNESGIGYIVEKMGSEDVSWTNS